jgi:hypothetical protein
MTKLIVAFRNFVNAPKNWSGPAAGVFCLFVFLLFFLNKESGNLL